MEQLYRKAILWPPKVYRVPEVGVTPCLGCRHDVKLCGVHGAFWLRQPGGLSHKY